MIGVKSLEDAGIAQAEDQAKIRVRLLRTRFTKILKDGTGVGGLEQVFLQFLETMPEWTAASMKHELSLILGPIMDPGSYDHDKLKYSLDSLNSSNTHEIVDVFLSWPLGRELIDKAKSALDAKVVMQCTI